MSTATFDTHRFITQLRKAGVEEKQAEAIAEAMQEANEGIDIVTKRDLALTSVELKKDLAEMKYDLMKWVIGLALAQVGLLVGILMRLPH